MLPLIKRNNIFPIPGINENLNLNNRFYHIQTEVLPNKLIVSTHIYHKGEIIYSDFVSFKKFYNDETITNENLKRGIIKLVKILHQKSLKWLKDENNKSGYDNRNEKLFIEWLIKVAENISKEYSHEIKVCHKNKSKVMKRINFTETQNKEREIVESFLENLITLSTSILKNKVKYSFFETNLNKYLFIIHRDNVGIFKFYKNFPTGIVTLELNRYLPLIENLN